MSKSSEEASAATDYISFALASAERVLREGFDGVPITRVTQFIVGWTRAAFAQSQVIATLARAGLTSAAAPNRRTVIEIAVRMQWLHSLSQPERAGALDAMLDYEREIEKKADSHLQSMGLVSDKDFTIMDELVLQSATGITKAQARQFLEAAKRTSGQSLGLYRAWTVESGYAHASGALAVAYAPKDNQNPYPPAIDPTLEIHATTLFLLISLTYRLLVDEGVEADAAMAIANAFLNVDRNE